ncbi:MAG: amidohydrolase [Chloroflexi bacterium]|nr:MAG: amidohydrolase [Chloroflexota bacterium]
MTKIDFLAEAHALRDELIAYRRDFHRHPELAFEEVRTASIVAQTLAELGLEVQTGVGKTGVVGVLEGDEDGPTVLVRADMDALPIHEQNQVEYASSVNGKMHACGHDGHTAIALSVAKIFAKYRAQIKGRIKFVFQPAEEIGAGAKAMIADGVLENPRPDVTLGLHLWNERPLGVLGLADGYVMAGSSELHIKITGKGGHGAAPHLAVDPIVCGAHIVTALQSVVSRNVPPLEQAVVSVTTFHSGTATNIIPSAAELSGTIRTFNPEVRDLVSQRIQEIVQNTAAALGCTAEVIIEHSTMPVYNHPEVAERLRKVFAQFIDESQFDMEERTMGAEDVGLFMQDIPGMFFFVGSANEARDLHYPHHHPRFDFDEEALPLSVALMSAAIAAYVLSEV